MPAPFTHLNLAQFAEVLDAFPFKRTVTAVHMHHTWRPNHAQWKGLASVEGMWRFHTQEREFSDIAQHLTIDPEGGIWTGRPWNQSPASAKGHNGNAFAGPFMIEVVGDFDKGFDKLQGEQLNALQAVIARINQRFKLAPQTLFFHNQAADKTCPGTAIDREAFVATLANFVPQPAAAEREGERSPFAPATLADDADLVRRTVGHLSAAPAARGAADSDEGELDYQHEVAGRSARSAARGGNGNGNGSRDASDAWGPEEIDALRPHVINLRMGAFSDNGLMTTRPSDVDAIFAEHLRGRTQAAAAGDKRLRLMLYAHGGLVRESSGLKIAAEQCAWWLDNGVYPIHFVWETGLLETLASLLTRAASPPGTRGWLDRLTDPLIEEAARALQIGRIWGAMKASAQLASAPDGGAHYFVARLANFVAAQKAAGVEVEIHAVGHSAGSIFQAHLLAAAQASGLTFKSLQLMAPAIRVDAFNQLVLPRLPAGQGLESLTVYTMRRDFELADNCAQIYRKSLLYLVSQACEPQRGTPILGLEDSLRDDPQTRALFGLGQAAESDRAEMVWSKTRTQTGRSASTATAHGGFDNDAPTMNAVLRRVLGVADDAVVAPFPASATRAAPPSWLSEVDWPPMLLQAAPGAAAGMSPGALAATGAAQTSGVVSVGASGAMAAAAAANPPPNGGATELPRPGGAKRRALCIGIDNYPTAPLSGCVNDAQQWAQALRRMGFEVSVLHNEQAHRNGILAALENLIAGAGPQDELVVQYAGHGAQLDDTDGDEADSDSPGKDEALCAHDFADGRFVLDDEIFAFGARVPQSASLTFFMDCCHSGDIGRLALDGAFKNSKPRRVVPTAGMKRAFAALMANAPRAAVRAAGAAPVGRARSVVFSACMSTEVAWESDGHGDFTTRAMALLETPAPGESNATFHARVLAAFGQARRQTPSFDAPPDRANRPLLGGL